MASNPKDEVLIAVLGVTGAGKTTFISKVTGRNDLKIGHGLKSCTQEVVSSSLVLDDKNIVLIDTPGFDDTTRTDAEILGLIAEYLAATYSQDRLLSGIILLQPINNNRVQGSERKRTRLFEKVCGPDAFPKVLIATTMWGDLQDEAVGHSRMDERQTSDDFWGKMIQHGARTVRHDNNLVSARNVLRMVLENADKMVLQMQTELVANDGQVSSTSAGRQLNSDLDETSRKLLEELRELQKELQQEQAKSAQAAADLREEIQELQQQLNMTQVEKAQLEKSRVFFDKTLSLVSATTNLGSFGLALANGCTIL